MSGDFLFGVGGYDNHLVPINSALMYDPRLRLWMELSPMASCRENFTAISMNGKLYAIGGMDRLTDTENGSDNVESDAAVGNEFTTTISLALRSCEW